MRCNLALITEDLQDDRPLRAGIMGAMHSGAMTLSWGAAFNHTLARTIHSYWFTACMSWFPSVRWLQQCGLVVCPFRWVSTTSWATCQLQLAFRLRMPSERPFCSIPFFASLPCHAYVTLIPHKLRTSDAHCCVLSYSAHLHLVFFWCNQPLPLQ
jgi:hypothetical protein